MSDQYSQYTVIDDIKINGKLTLGEDVADLGGTWLAYLAWKSATKDQDLQPMDGFTPDQRFFIGMAQWACGDERAGEQARERHHQSDIRPMSTGSTAWSPICRSSERRSRAAWGSRWCTRSLVGFGSAERERVSLTASRASRLARHTSIIRSLIE